MKRSGLVISAGVLGIIRGALGTFGGVSTLAMAAELDAFIPGLGALIYFEFALSVTLIVVSIWALVKSNHQPAGSAIRAWGYAFIVAGVVDLVWGLALMGAVPEATASGIGSLIAFALIGALFASGGHRLSQQVMGDSATRSEAE